eukprot:scaffold231126_cov43-Attheya_sp.AAC.1
MTAWLCPDLPPYVVCVTLDFLRLVPINSYFIARARQKMTSSFRRGCHNVVWAVLINSSVNRDARELVKTSREITKPPSCVS